MKKLVKVMTSLLGLALLFTGCAKKDGGTATNASGEKEITFMFWDDLEATTDLISLGYGEVIKRFNAADNGYHVNVISTNLEEYYNLVNARVASNQTPDVFIASPGPDMYQYTDKGIALDLTSYLNADSAWKSSFNNGVFSRTTREGKIMAIPLNIAAACCFYNTEIFKECGITSEPATLDDLYAACDKIKAKGYTPISCSAGTAWCLSMVAGYLCERNNVDLEAIKSGADKWTNANCIAAGKDLQKISSYFSPNAAGLSNDEATAEFYNEKAAILIQGSWVIGQMNGANPPIQDKCGVFAFPAKSGSGDNQSSIIAKSDSLCVSAKTKCPEACIELLKYFTDQTAQAYTAEVGGKFPVTNATIDFNKAPKQLKYVLNVMGKANKQFGFYNESLASSAAGAEFDNNMVSLFLKQSTPEQAFAAVQEYYEMEDLIGK